MEHLSQNVVKKFQKYVKCVHYFQDVCYNKKTNNYNKR